MGAFLGIFQGGLDHLDTLEKSLEMPIICFARKKKLFSRTFKISGTLIVKNTHYSRPLVFSLLSCFGLWN
jgi:hypothetical protein